MRTKQQAKPKAATTDIKTEKKFDPEVNGDVEHLIARQRKRERELVPLRIDHQTVIYVTKDKQTPEYAEEYRKKHGISQPRSREPDNPRKGSNCIDHNRIIELHRAGVRQKEIVKLMGCCLATVSRVIVEYKRSNK